MTLAPQSLKIVRMTYPRELEQGWKASCDMLSSSCSSDYLKNILVWKASQRGGGTRRFFGEAYVATQIKHIEGYYGSFQWLTSQAFLGERPFPPGETQGFQQQYRAALWRHFPGKLARLQRTSHTLEQKTGIRPAAPDLWLVESSGHHRFIEVKLPKDEVGENQLAGLAVIAASLGDSADLDVEIVELNPDREGRFAEFVRQSTSSEELLRVIWTEDNGLISGAGHGVDFFFSGRVEGPAELVAVLLGFEWLHGKPDSVEVRVRSADTVADTIHLNEVRAAIERYIHSRKAVEGRIAPALHAHVNG